MATTFIAQLADLAVSELQANKTEALALITSAEGSIEAAVSNAIKNAPKPGGLLGTVWPLIVGQADSFATKLVASYGPEVIFDFIALEAANWAKSVGG